MYLKNYYQDNLVFQQGKEFIVKGGGATASLKIFLETDNKTIDSSLKINKDGSFKAVFKPLAASNKPFKLIALDNEKRIEISHIYCGDVFLFIGQSNISVPLKLALNKEKYISRLFNNKINYLKIDEREITKEGYIIRPDEPLDDIDKIAVWKTSDDKEIVNYSALGLMFASLLKEKINYPIGIVEVATGGLSIDTFIERSYIINNKNVLQYLKETDKYIEKETTFGPASYTKMCGVYNEKIAPLLDIKFKSLIYYQGENSASTFERGRAFFDSINLIIDSYRELFHEPDLTFNVLGINDEYYCYGDDYGYQYVTEAISQIEKKNVYIVPLYDIKPEWMIPDGDFIYHPIHPVNKEIVAKRLCKVVYANLYKNKLLCPPKIVDAKIDKDKIVLNIDCFGSKLKCGSFEGFFVAGNDNCYQYAEAICSDEKTIVLSSKDVNEPKYYLYGLMQYSYVSNCKAINGLPLLPKRSKCEKMDSKHYLSNQIVLGCDYLYLDENNFGADVGGGFKVPLWEKGDIYRNPKIKLSLNKLDKTQGTSSLFIHATLDKKDFGFFGIKCNLGYSGLHHRLADFPYLNLDIKGSLNISFEGALFRINGKIKKFPLFSKDNSALGLLLSNDWSTYSLDLNYILDGSKGYSPTSKEIISNLSSIEFYFRTNKEKATILIDNLRFSNTPLQTISKKKDIVELDNKLKLPENN